MTGRSLQVSSEKLTFVKQALAKIGLTQEILSKRLNYSRSTVSKFFNEKPVDCEKFFGICQILGLNPQDVACQDYEIEITDIDSLVQEVRQKIKPFIQERCGTMRVLDMNQPIGLNDIYTNVNILEKITAHRRKEITELLKECNFEDFERFGLGRISEKRVPGLEAVEKYPKLMILGKPGAGKTTFLKYLAIQSIEGKFKTELVPIFITLKDFAEANDKPNLLKYISQQLSNCQVTDNQIVEIFQHNKALILLDGLDEVREEDSQRVLKEIRDFSELFRDNRFVMTCRIAAKEYTFEKFSEVEVADFNEQQIATFANNWFKDKAVKPENFLHRLQENQRIYELATNPLLLTLLCLVFEESGDFPANRSELYQEGIDALLKKWDAKRGIQRDQFVYKKLSVQRKEDLLSKIALNTFEGSDYFFKQKIAEQHIIEYIRNLSDASTEAEVLQLDSERVLKSIEAQHGLLVERAKGIYSFSHLTFHEYFTAREFITVQQSSEVALKILVSQMMEKRWREVFLLAVGMSPNANHLLILMKQQADMYISKDEKLQIFLNWLNQKSVSINFSGKLAAIRAIYLYLQSHDKSSFIHISEHISEKSNHWLSIIFHNLNYFGAEITTIPKIAHQLNPGNIDYYEIDDLMLDINFFQALNHALRRASTLNKSLDGIINCSLARNINNDFTMEINCNHEPELMQELQQLKKQLPNPEGNKLKFKKWWRLNGQDYLEKLKSLIIKYRNIGHDWQFNEQQEELLKQYYDANELLIECLNSDCYVSREVRQYIEDTLLLPISEIEKYPKPNL
jgi:predicted NACHT family NTPase